MAELSNDAPLRFLGEAVTEKFLADSSAAQTIYKGAGVIIDQSVDTTKVVTASGVTAVDADVFVGICAGKLVVAIADPETERVEVLVEPTVVGFKSAVFTDADLGKTIYMSDTGTLTASNGAYPQIGKLYRVMDGYAYVALESPKVLDVP